VPKNNHIDYQIFTNNKIIYLFDIGQWSGWFWEGKLRRHLFFKVVELKMSFYLVRPGRSSFFWTIFFSKRNGRWMVK
jgi:hypothetical protein